MQATVVEQYGDFGHQVAGIFWTGENLRKGGGMSWDLLNPRHRCLWDYLADYLCAEVW